MSLVLIPQDMTDLSPISRMNVCTRNDPIEMLLDDGVSQKKKDTRNIKFQLN